MNFARAGAWAQVSDDGRYSIAAGKTNGEYSFLAYRLGKPSTLLGGFTDAKDARAACETDAQQVAA